MVKARVKIVSGDDAPHAAFGSKVLLYPEGKDEPVEIPHIRDIKINLPVNGVVSATIELFPASFEVEAIAELFPTEITKEVLEQQLSLIYSKKKLEEHRENEQTKKTSTKEKDS